jgi:hypothetical protein
VLPASAFHKEIFLKIFNGSLILLETTEVPRGNYISASKKMNQEAPYGG